MFTKAEWAFHREKKKSRALGTISHTKKSQKCMEVSEMYLKTLLYIKTVQKVWKSDKNEVITDRQTDRLWAIVKNRVAARD